MNLSQLQAECSRLLSDPNNDRWSLSVLTTRLNLAQSEIAGYTNCLQVTEDLTPTANTSAVLLAPGGLTTAIFDVIRVTITTTGGDVLPLPGITVEELDIRYPNWRQWSAGQPFTWWYNETNRQLNLVPAPDAANAITNGLQVREARTTDDMVNSTDSAFGGEVALLPYNMAVVHWTVALCFQDDGTPEALAKSKFHRSGSLKNPGEYELFLKRILSEFESSQVVPSSIIFKPQGGRIGTWYIPNKSNPLGGIW